MHLMNLHFAHTLLFGSGKNIYVKNFAVDAVIQSCGLIEMLKKFKEVYSSRADSQFYKVILMRVLKS